MALNATNEAISKMKIFTTDTLSCLSSLLNKLKQTQSYDKKESKSALCSDPSPPASSSSMMMAAPVSKSVPLSSLLSTGKSITAAKTTTMTTNTDLSPNADDKPSFEIKQMTEQKQQKQRTAAVATMTLVPSQDQDVSPSPAENGMQGRAAGSEPARNVNASNSSSFRFSTDDVVGNVSPSKSSPSQVVTILTTVVLPILLLLVEALVHEPSCIKWISRCVMNMFCVNEATTLWLWLYLYLYVMKVSCSASEICTFFYKSCFIL